MEKSYKELREELNARLQSAVTEVSRLKKALHPEMTGAYLVVMDGDETLIIRAHAFYDAGQEQHRVDGDIIRLGSQITFDSVTGFTLTPESDYRKVERKEVEEMVEKYISRKLTAFCTDCEEIH